MEPYDLISAKAAEIGLPVHYKTDLTEHDREFLEKERPEKFIWMVREMGTHLLPLVPAESRERQLGIVWMRAVVGLHPEARGFLCSNGKLKEIDVVKTFPPNKRMNVNTVG